jgi:hypothetical protein
MECPKRKRIAGPGEGEHARTWADVVVRGDSLQTEVERACEGRKDDTEGSQIEQLTCDDVPLGEDQQRWRGSIVTCVDAQGEEESRGVDTTVETVRDSPMVDNSKPGGNAEGGERGWRGRKEKGMKESVGGTRDTNRIKEGTGRTHELWSEDRDIEVVAESPEDDGNNPKRQKKLQLEGPNEKPPDRARSRSQSILSGVC